MLLTVLMRWPVLILISAVGGGGFFAYKEYGLPEQVVTALNLQADAPRKQISDSVKVMPVAADAAIPATVVVESQPVEVTKPAKQVSVVEQYRVVEGDSLSKIAARRVATPIAQEVLIRRIFSDNPQAFENENENRLRAGVAISIHTTK